MYKTMSLNVIIFQIILEGYVDDSKASKLQTSNNILRNNMRVLSTSDHNTEDLEIVHKNANVSKMSAAGVSISAVESGQISNAKKKMLIRLSMHCVEKYYFTVYLHNCKAT